MESKHKQIRFALLGVAVINLLTMVYSLVLTLKTMGEYSLWTSLGMTDLISFQLLVPMIFAFLLYKEYKRDHLLTWILSTGLFIFASTTIFTLPVVIIGLLACFDKAIRTPHLDKIYNDYLNDNSKSEPQHEVKVQDPNLKNS